MRSRTRTSLLALAVTFLVGLALPASAQNRPKIPPPEFECEWEEDADGYRQWKPFAVTCLYCKGAKKHVCLHCKDSDVPICLECDKTERAPCRTCAATGKMLDPKVELVCPYCWGSSWYRCGLCNSFGKLTVEGVDTKCGACKQKGLLKCMACNGKRRVPVYKLGRKGVAEASIKDLNKALVTLRETLAELEKFEPGDNPSRTAKDFAKVLAPLDRSLKVSKDMRKMLDAVLKGVKSYGAGYASYEERLTYQFLVFKDRTVYLLQFQIRLLEQCLARAEFNEQKKDEEG